MSSQMEVMRCMLVSAKTQRVCEKYCKLVLR
jgi:hypothetical protein